MTNKKCLVLYGCVTADETNKVLLF